ncbi:HEPN domain-containing protein [Mesorhizobium sp. M7A.T.Ca.TU.009.01.3.2]|jgi:hypothetical protein|uniref:HEPN domain-containing protein n=1 Tax=unclassified Mesorhizobium TaxID=325217 RepID=UPI000FCBE307|nr:MULTISPECIES: HEPN domain-containing protein [unclassified Mesorhizobium]RUU07812.1 HEPN domain-containing protein [Mesorhizobium sp. M7A.T.Ca.TU.009.01.3.2]RUU76893.1 HEPN domain-containing protein [Mesorhizobium sp. M7A.T.Ca.TU.009.01.3.1]RUV50474.1 HEPN domain-containing protein [Mesorhizobium sp. M7A.F.Ca.MR.228.00.0.0]RUV19603.1 HEPN domain-containing protein [Mesorhizobium sp. M7A.F.Ca.MR.245.00.0.0]RWN47928.1 MAG: HEPN domain-containing protein [Mesorhizobium sp.]
MTLERTALQAIANAKLQDAELLFQNERYSNAYYLFGYAAEIAIKARISRVFQPDTIPDKKFVQDIYSHDLNRLVALAGLSADLNESRTASPVFDGHWSAVSDWNEASRYDMIDVFEATAMRNAMVDEEQGIFRWLQGRW